jgi:predicted transcriptional regulator
MGGFEVDDVFDVLRSRVALLDALSEGEKSPTDLKDELSVSRSTIDRGLDELERVGFVEVTGATVRTTLSGRVAFDTYTRTVGQLDQLGTLTDVFASLPPDTQFDPVMFHGARSVVADGPDDERPFDRLTAFIEATTSIQGCIRDIRQEQLDSYYRRIVEHDVSVRLVATDDVVERLITTFRPQLVELLDVDSFILRTIDSLPYSLLVFESPQGPVAVLAIYESDRLVGVVHNDAPEAVAWARTQIDHCWNTSGTLPLTASSDE